ncbi:MAG: bifunctional methionine sulfoxide reductase B/A protein [Candidatus Riflebacteria bacterium]|nr:bifunctional methionine sulfoxide reductase B/A protein [Candidatus Riflebacteria bacterium]
MKFKVLFFLSIILVIGGAAMTQPDSTWKTLTAEEEAVIQNKATEPPFSGKYVSEKRSGIYHCKRCGAALYRSIDKFESDCGWPSFDDEISGAVKRTPDADGRRIEILCNNCGAHLGHVFEGERLTSKNIRHCVNSISMDFKSFDDEPLQKAYFAGGCFWGMEYYFRKTKGVISTTVGFMGGKKENPSYEEVCTGETGHIETLEVEFLPSQITYEELAQLFFEIHDPTQVGGQGPDIGQQYISCVFTTDNTQKATTDKLIKFLLNKGLKVVTKVEAATKFWPAEDYHQQYYEKNGKTPYCHTRRKLF